MDLATTLTWAAERYPQRRAVGGTGRVLTFREWDAVSYTHLRAHET